MRPIGQALLGSVVVSALLGLAIVAHAKSSQPDTLAVAARNEFGGGAMPYETVVIAKHHGLDYPRVVSVASKGGVAALRRLMRFTVGSGLDAASAEGHDAVLAELLRRVGDAKFALALRQESPAVRKAVADSILYDTNLTPRLSNAGIRKPRRSCRRKSQKPSDPERTRHGAGWPASDG